jgi:hypothetical protein
MRGIGRRGILGKVSVSYAPVPRGWGARGRQLTYEAGEGRTPG